VSYPEFTDMVNELLIIAKEELSHFEMVHEKIKARGFKLGPERKDSYVNELYKFMRKGFRREIVLMDRLLFSAMIEARSCERFKVLSENINDKELAGFYRELMISEAGHYTTFIQLAKKHLNPEEVDKRWKEWLEHESKVIANYGKGETIHG
jgi:tRNA-(ms[2]io[6]A)-hydroxylase